MPLLILCFVGAMTIQCVILFHLRGHYSKVRYLSFAILEIAPFSGALYEIVMKPGHPYLGWEFRAAMCLWVAGAVLLGYMLAWGIYIVKRKKLWYSPNCN